MRLLRHYWAACVARWSVRYEHAHSLENRDSSNRPGRDGVRPRLTRYPEPFVLPPGPGQAGPTCGLHHANIKKRALWPADTRPAGSLGRERPLHRAGVRLEVPFGLETNCQRRALGREDKARRL